VGSIGYSHVVFLSNIGDERFLDLPLAGIIGLEAV
jgi:hypothetical protein